MRLIIKIASEGYMPFNKINKHTVQGMLYSHLKATKYEDLHAKKGFKFFTFSDLFPANDFYPGKEKTLLVSSPNWELIETWYNQFRKIRYLYLSDQPFKIVNVKKFSLPLKTTFETGSPVVLYKDNHSNTYLSFKRNDDLRFFMERMKDNALKKFNAFYNDDFTMDGPIFDLLQFKKEVVVKLKKEEDEFAIIGTMWKSMEKMYVGREYRKFYMFIMDTGLGEKNSLGFGFVNPVREKRKNSKVLMTYEYD